MSNTELAIINRILMLKGRKTDNGRIVAKLERRFRKMCEVYA